MAMRAILRIVIGLSAIVGAASSAIAQDGTNILLVINEASEESQQVGAYYAKARSIPASNILRIRTAAIEEIERIRFDFEIERPIMGWITLNSAHDRILYVVLTKGIPLRINGTGGLDGTVASVDSELTLLYRKLLGTSVPPSGRAANPYFHGDRPLAEARPFSHVASDMFLVTRIDGFTVADALRGVDRGAAPVQDGIFVLDQKANVLGDRSGDAWLASTADRLAAAGFKDRVLLDTTRTVVAGRKQVMGYYSWGSNDPAISRRRFDIDFSAGALAGMFVSTDARTFKEPPATWNVGSWRDPTTHFEGSPQSLIGDLIREGATGVAGHVAEPYLDAVVRPHILFPAYVAGFNLAESFYLAMPYLSWQTVVIGDPLCAPFRTSDMHSERSTLDVDPSTELPALFSARRLKVLSDYGVRPDIATLMLKASVRISHSNLDGAREPLEMVTALEPSLNAAHFVLATIYDAFGEHDRAIARYRTILASAPSEVRSLNNLAYTLAVNKGNPVEALPLAERAYSLAIDIKMQLTLDVGYSLVARKGTPANALPFAPEGYNVPAIRAQIIDTLGWVHHLLGNDAQAEQYLAEAVKGSPLNAEVQFHMAVIDAARGRPEAARVRLKNAIALDSELEKRADVQQLSATINKPQP